MTYLTPGHLIIGSPISAAPGPSQKFTPKNRLNRRDLIQVSKIFWRQWSIHYIHCFQKHYKWSEVTPNIRIEDMVLIKQDNLPPSQWFLGRFLKCNKGKDNCIRLVRVKTVNSEYDRPISNICLFPFKSWSEQNCV